MWKIIAVFIAVLQALLIPAMAMSDGLAPETDRFSRCAIPGGNPSEVHECYFSVGAEVEHEMVQAYRLAQTALGAFDQKHSLDDERSMSALLQETQIAFEQYRKLHCQFPEREALGGTGAMNVTVFCRVELSLFRIRQLTEYADIY